MQTTSDIDTRKAITQLGDEKPDVRIGGIYALERVARDSARDHPTIVEVLTAFVREHSHEQGQPSGPGGQEQARPARADIQAAAAVIGRRDRRRDIQRIDLARANLARANLALAHLTGADLTRADLSSTQLTVAHLADATSPARTSATRTSAARASAARTSAARTSAAQGGPQVRPFRRAGNEIPAPAGWRRRALTPGQGRRASFVPAGPLPARRRGAGLKTTTERSVAIAS